MNADYRESHDKTPNSSNFFGVLFTNASIASVVTLFKDDGWRTRKCDWTSYELNSEYAELVVECNKKGEILIHGGIADIEKNFRTHLPLFLARCSIDYQLESYDDDHELIRELKSKN